MKARMNIETEYSPCGLTSQGTWRPFSVARFRSRETAEQCLEEHKRIRAANPFIPSDFHECKIMKRTVVTVIGEWEDV